MDTTNMTYVWPESTTHDLMLEQEEENVVIEEDPILYILMTINFTIICEIIDIFGTVNNIINIVIFVKLGFGEQVNISLFGLAVSDLCSLLVLHWLNLCYIPYFKALDLPFDPYDVQYLTAGFPHVLFNRITASITAFITFERCLCVYMPLKVKTILNPPRVKIVISSVYVVNLMCAAPFYYGSHLGPKFFEDQNRTIIGLVFTKERVLIERIIFATMHVTIPIGALITVVSCTAIIVVKMKEKSKWRASTNTSSAIESVDNGSNTTSTTEKPGNRNTMSNRDQKVTRMVVVISCIFLLCFIPLIVMFVPIIIEPEFSIHGKYKGLYAFLSSVVFILESLNSSVNIFIYYRMSSKYREEFDKLFFKKKSAL